MTNTSTLSRRFPVALRTALAGFVAITLLAGCGGSSHDDPAAAPAYPAPTDPTVMLVVDGLPVHQAEIESAERFQQIAFPQDPEVVRRQRALNNDVIPLAAVRSRYSKMLDGMTAEVNKFRSMQDHETFDHIQQLFTFQDKEYHGRYDGWRYPSQFQLSTQALAAMDTPVGELSQPFVTFRGVHVLKVLDVIENSTPALRKIHYAEIIALFERPAEAERIAQQIVAGAHVQWVHPDYKSFVNPQYLYRFELPTPQGAQGSGR